MNSLSMSEMEIREAREHDAKARVTAQTVFDRPVVVEAGAGTGKTSILVARIVVWSLSAGWERALARLDAAAPAGRQPSLEDVATEVLGRVAAITFTEALAASPSSGTSACSSRSRLRTSTSICVESADIEIPGKFAAGASGAR